VANVDVGQDRQTGQRRLAVDDLLQQLPGHAGGPLEPADDQAAEDGATMRTSSPRRSFGGYRISTTAC